MTTDDLRAAARQIVASLILDHPQAASVVASLVLSELLALGLYGDGDESDVQAFADAINAKIEAIAAAHGGRPWQLVPAGTLPRH